MPITSEDAPLKQVRRRGRTWLYAALLVPLSGLLLLGLSVMRPQRIGPMVLSTELTWQPNPGYRVSGTVLHKGHVTGPLHGEMYRSMGDGIVPWGWIGHFRYMAFLLNGHPVAPDKW